MERATEQPTMRGTPSPSSRPRLRRWLIALTVLLVLLGAYAVALDRMAQRLGEDMQKSMRMQPSVDDERHRAN